MIIAIMCAVIVLVALLLGAIFRVVRQYERGVVFRFGQLRPEIRGPGLALIVPFVDRLQKVNMQIVTQPVPAQDGITRDNVTVRVDAVCTTGLSIRPGRRRCPGLRLRDPAGRPGRAALDHRQERARRPALQSGKAQRRPGTDDRQPGARVGQCTSIASRSRTSRCPSR